jgi:hypothetical protein
VDFPSDIALWSFGRVANADLFDFRRREVRRRKRATFIVSLFLVASNVRHKLGPVIAVNRESL